MSDKKNIVIIGAGLVGSLLAIFLARRGYTVRVYERRGDMRRQKISAGRSINLALSDRGIRALEEVGIMDELRPICIPMHGRSIHNTDGTSAFQAYGKEGQFINSVSRGTLNCRLMDLAEKNGATIFFHHRCDGIDWKNNMVKFAIDKGEENGETEQQDFDILFGADGAYSAVRLHHQLQHDRFQYSQYYIDFGYKELHIPAGKNGEFLLEKNALHIWPRGNYMLIALPNIDGSFTCTLFFPFEGEPSFASLDSKEKVLDFFKKTFSDATEIMPGLTDDFFHNPTSSLVTVRCFPWTREGRFALIGDAAHAIVPFFGQGMNCGFEDCSVLNKLIEEKQEDWTAIFKSFEELRKPDADAIAELALNNFIEMRDKVGDPKFLLQKKIEARLYEKFPAKWIPAYSQVTFSPQIRYSEALRRGQKQENIMQQVMKNIPDDWNNEKFLQSVIEKIDNNGQV
jgi:kynurenine 3-monooxygenase